MIEKRNCEIKIEKLGESGHASIQFVRWQTDSHKLYIILSSGDSYSILTIEKLTIEDLKDLQNKIKNLIPVLEKEKACQLNQRIII